MKKKALIFLTLIPFIVGVLAFVTSNFVIRGVEQDIDDIEWSYEANSPFMMNEGKKKLDAKSVFDDTYPLSEGNELSWSSSDEDVCKIEKINEDFYLVPLKEGRSTISCFNTKKTVVKSFVAVIVGESGAIIVNPIKPFSQKSLADTHYVGLYDSKENYDAKIIDANLKLDVKVVGGNLKESEIEVSYSDNVNYNKEAEVISFIKEGPVKFEFKNPYTSDTTGNASLEFNLVDAINIYNYNDLMEVTNRTEKNYKAVLRVNLESLKNTYELDENGKAISKKRTDTELFGELENGKVKSFKDDIYRFETTYNHTFLDSWNEAVRSGKLTDKKEMSTDILTGVHIKDDFYGNGFTINTHELTYPSDEQIIVVDDKKYVIPLLSEDDLFRGPLPYVSLGTPYLDPNDVKAMFTLFAQDNSSFYIDRNDVTLLDVHFKGCDFGTNLSNLEYVGTTLDIHGNNVKVLNSVIENSRNVVRTYSSNNLLIKNTMLRNSMEFLLRSGANEANNVDLEKNVTYTGKDGKKLTTKNSSYLGKMDFSNIVKDYKADSLLTFGAISGTQANEFVRIDMLDYTKKEYVQSKEDVTKALTNSKGIIDSSKNKVYKGSTTVDKVFFVNSGISAISLDTAPQGSFIENQITTLFALILGIYMNGFYPSHLALTSYPTLITIKGDTRFYDWKTLDNLTFESLIDEDIRSLIVNHGGLSGIDIKITEDDYLPLKKLMVDNYKDKVVKDDKVNLPVYIQGGGSNYSDIIFEDDSYLSEVMELDPYVYSLDLKADHTDHFNSDSVAKYQAMKIAMLRAVSNVMGFNNHKLIGVSNSSSRWFNEYPSIEELK